MATKKAATKKAKNVDSEKKMATVYIMGKAHKVPADATIMGAIEYAGYLIKRGAGCREGFCGACATVYRLPGDYKIYTGLACTTIVEDEMWLTQLPSFPGQKAIYDIKKIQPNVATIQKMYPEVRPHITNYNEKNKTSIRRYFHTKTLDKFDKF